MFERDVFVSYHRDSSLAVATALAAELGKEPKIHAWIDRDEMKPGDAYPPDIERGIKNSHVFVIVASPEYVDILRADERSRSSNRSAGDDHFDADPADEQRRREWVCRELAFATDMKKVILPVFHGMKHEDKCDFERLTRVSNVQAGELERDAGNSATGKSSIAHIATSIRREVDNVRVIPKTYFAWFRGLVVGTACVGLALLLLYNLSAAALVLAGSFAFSCFLLYRLRDDLRVGTLTYYEFAAATRKDVYLLGGLLTLAVVMNLLAEMVCQYCLDERLLDLIAGGAPFFLVQLIAGAFCTMGAAMLVITIAPGAIARGALVRSALKGGLLTSAIITPAGIYGWLVRQLLQGDNIKMFIVKSLIVVPGTAITCAGITGVLVRVISLPAHRGAFIRATDVMTWVFGTAGIAFNIIALAGNTPGPNGWLILVITPAMLIVFVAVFRLAVFLSLRLWRP